MCLPVAPICFSTSENQVVNVTALIINVIQIRKKRNAWAGAGQWIAAGDGLAGDISQAPRPCCRQMWISPRDVG